MGGNLGQFNQVNERLSWLTEELQLYLCLLLTTTAEIRGDYCRIYGVKDIRQLYHESIFSTSLVVLFFCQKLGKFLINCFFLCPGRQMYVTLQRLSNRVIGGNLQQICHAVMLQIGKGGFILLPYSNHNSRRKRPKQAFKKQSRKTPLFKNQRTLKQIVSKFLVRQL